ncbi:MAG: SCO family protein [Gammaproteobacteria bacterium]|nr:SCO family protein [Gammaproteobacteria bacterium]
MSNTTFNHRANALGTFAGVLLMLLMIVPPPAVEADTVVRQDAVQKFEQGGWAPDSFYQLEVDLHGHDGQDSSLDRYAGGPVVMTMFYGSCPHVCPMLISSIQAAEQKLPADQRSKLRVLMVSIDAERDTPQSLAAVAEQHGVDSSRWTLASASAMDVRKVAAVLGIRFRKLPDGDYNHTSEMILVDPVGREITRSSQLGVPAEDFVAALREATD